MSDRQKAPRTEEVRRPLVRYHGGKWKLAPWIISHFPAHRCYVEPFGGGGSVLLRKARSYAEVYNDLDGEMVNLFRVLRDHGDELRRRIEMTPFAWEEFDLSFDRINDEIEQARRTAIRAFMGFGSAVTRATREDQPMRTGFRCKSNKSGTTPARDWMNLPDCLPAVIDRLRGIVIENRPACKVMETHDRPDVLHYVDPPYVHSTRTADTGGSRRGYRHEMTDDDHRALADCLNGLKGMVVLSGYHSPLYDEIFKGWQRVERAALADGAAKRTEVLWFRNIEPLPDLFPAGIVTP